MAFFDLRWSTSAFGRLFLNCGLRLRSGLHCMNWRSLTISGALSRVTSQTCPHSRWLFKLSNNPRIHNMSRD